MYTFFFAYECKHIPACGHCLAQDRPGKPFRFHNKVFEVAKVMTAGLVGVIGFSLNELIEKGLMSLGIPFASFIAECLSGLFSGIM